MFNPFLFIFVSFEVKFFPFESKGHFCTLEPPNLESCTLGSTGVLHVPPLARGQGISDIDRLEFKKYRKIGKS